MKSAPRWVRLSALQALVVRAETDVNWSRQPYDVQWPDLNESPDSHCKKGNPCHDGGNRHNIQDRIYLSHGSSLTKKLIRPIAVFILSYFY